METIATKAMGHLDIGGHFARVLLGIAQSQDPLLELAARFTASAVQNGHVCADLSRVADFPSFFQNDDTPSISYPNVRDWIEALIKSPVVGAPGDYRPLILDGSRLYLHRYWQYEQTLASAILERARSTNIPRDPALFSSLAGRAFPFGRGDDDPLGKALYTAGMKNLLVISGGPGTGKTTAAVTIISLLLELSGEAPCRIVLTAPTGKAAARLKQSIRLACAEPGIPEAMKNRFPMESSTIHRLLGVIPNSTHFKYNSKNPLPYDVIVIDEASMADIALMTKFLSAIPPHTKVIILGDKDQLASVDAGAVLGDICDSGKKHRNTPEFADAVASMFPGVSLPSDSSEPFLADSIVELTTNYRFKENSGIGSVAHAIKEGRAEDSRYILDNNDYDDIRRHGLPSAESLQSALHPTIVNGYARYRGENDPGKAIDLFNTFRLLCAVKNGPFGVAGINAAIERILAREGLIRPISPWYPGRPVMIVANDYNLGLFNGDIGITLPDRAAGNELKVFFPGVAEGEFRSFPPLRLPPHETVFAMTVHKAQGSEFDHVALVLPPVFTPVLSRELLYTGITRARSKCDIWCSMEIFMRSVENRTVRMSGLRDTLWKPEGKSPLTEGP
jgi:exodeoxyribonuclease V alpha subunit